MKVYEEILSRDIEWALREGSMHFEDRSAVHQTLKKIARRLDEMGVPYAIAGGMALFAHGFRRFTEDVDILITAQGLQDVHKHLKGRGYVPLFRKSRNLRDAEYGVRIEFLITGDFPGDGKPKAVAFPNPSDVDIEIEGIRYVQLPRLIDLKLASGMSSPGRLRDLADVQELIRVLALPAGFTEQLDPSVREKFMELWNGLHGDREDFTKP
jgi:hypothetical protein